MSARSVPLPLSTYRVPLSKRRSAPEHQGEGLVPRERRIRVDRTNIDPVLRNVEVHDGVGRRSRGVAGRPIGEPVVPRAAREHVGTLLPLMRSWPEPPFIRSLPSPPNRVSLLASR
jgi:hypothetical protein